MLCWQLLVTKSSKHETGRLLNQHSYRSKLASRPGSVTGLARSLKGLCQKILMLHELQTKLRRSSNDYYVTASEKSLSQVLFPTSLFHASIPLTSIRVIGIQLIFRKACSLITRTRVERGVFASPKVVEDPS